MAKSAIRKEIEGSFMEADRSALRMAQQELDILEDTEGLFEKNNLEQFYEIWQKYKGKEKGDKNDINSWCAFLLGMTSKQPKGEFLPKRRAYARAGFPDIDTDFDDQHKEDVVNYLVEKYGKDHAMHIGTYGSLKTRSCLTRVVKALDIANAFHKGKDAYISENAKMVETILSPLPKGFIAGKMQVMDENSHFTPIESVEDAYRLIPAFKSYMDKYPDILRYASKTQGLASNFGIHASGVVVSDIPLSRLAPARKIAKGNDFATQFTHEELESIGLIKFDILAIATLTIITNTVKLIKQNYNIDLDIEHLPLDDKPALALFRSGDMTGVFQCESIPMRNTMRDIEVDRFYDVVVAIAMFRPGPMAYIPEYCARKKGDKAVDYFHPSIEPYVKKHLDSTYGIACFQEQIMQICNSLAGFSVTEGYQMIKGIGKKKEHIINRFKKRFIEGCVGNSVPKDVAEQYWEKFITPFSSYGFNLAHACCYGYTAWICAFLKANYPDEFACALLNTEVSRGNHDKIILIEKEFKNKLKIRFLERNINDCDIEYKIVRKKDPQTGTVKTEIRPALMCKGVGRHAATEIVASQPHKDLESLVANTSATIIDTDILGSLIDAGYFKGKRGQNKKDKLIKTFKQIRESIRKAAKKGVPLVDIAE